MSRKSARSGGRRERKVRVKTARRRSAASTRWLERQLNDPYVAEARRLGYRSRAAFKLIEIDDRLRLLRPGQVVVDLGAAPGGWTQVALERTAAAGGGGAAGGRVVALDRLEIDPIPGADILCGDFRDPQTLARLASAVGAAAADLVLSDLSPSATGHRATDHLRMAALAEEAFDFAARALRPGGAFVAKTFRGGADAGLLKRVRLCFATVRHIKPPASRAGSAETYLVARGFRPPAG